MGRGPVAAGRTSVPLATAAASDAWTGRPSGRIWPRARVLPSASAALANVPVELPPKMNPYSGPGRPRGFWIASVIWFARNVSCWTPFDWRVGAATPYIANPSNSRAQRVERPLQRTSRQRTVRISRLSVAIASASARSRPDAAQPSRTVEPVPPAADGLDPVAFRAELGPEVMDISVDGVGRDGDAEGPGLVEELIAAQGLAGMAQQRFEQGELARAEVDRPVVDRGRAGRRRAACLAR